MTFRIINNRLLLVKKPGVAVYRPEYYNEKVIIPISKIASISIVQNYLEIRLVNNDRFGYFPDSAKDATAAFEKLTAILSGEDTPSPELK